LHAGAFFIRAFNDNLGNISRAEQIGGRKAAVGAFRNPLQRG